MQIDCDQFHEAGVIGRKLLLVERNDGYGLQVM